MRSHPIFKSPAEIQVKLLDTITVSVPAGEAAPDKANTDAVEDINDRKTINEAVMPHKIAGFLSLRAKQNIAPSSGKSGIKFMKCIFI